MAQSFGNITKLPELRKRLVFTLLMMGIYRLGVFIPTPGIDVVKLQAFLSSGEAQKTLFNFVNLFNGGALEKFSIFALGIMPYISASIIFQLLTVSLPALKKIQDEGESGRNKINQWTRYASVVLTIFQGSFISYGLYQKGYVLSNIGEVQFVLSTMITLAAGTCFIMWLDRKSVV